MIRFQWKENAESIFLHPVEIHPLVVVLSATHELEKTAEC